MGIMNLSVMNGKTLLVDGPASVTLVSGKVEVFGYTLRNMEKIVIRDGKRMPFFVKETASFNISLGESANMEEVDGNTIPFSWNKACEELLIMQTRPVTALVLGTVDSGKTSFCTYLANKLLNEKHKVAILDGDLGQSDIGPPCTMAYAFISRYITDLFDLKAENAFFVGVTSPSKAVGKVIQGVTLLNKEILANNPKFVIVNTDGWVEGEDAVNYKVQLVEKISPSIVFCVKQNERLATLLDELKVFKTMIVDPPPTIKQRSRDKRKSLRELGYMKYLKNSRVQSIPINWLKIESDGLVALSQNFGSIKRVGEIYGLLKVKPLYVAELGDKVFLVIERNRRINPENIQKTEEFLGKKVVVTFKGDERGLLVALYNVGGRFLGIGVLREIDYKRKVIKIYTPVSSGISTVAIGKVRLDENLREIVPPTLEQSREIS